MKKLSNISSQKLISQILRWGTQIIFASAIVVMAYLSFVENVNINFDLRKLTTIAIVGIALNYIVYNSYYRKNHEIVIQTDLLNADNGKYSIHKRYYFARKGWKDGELRDAIRAYNQTFVKSWKQDVEDVCARTEEEIVNGPYKGCDHKLLIWRLKHHRYPKSGIRGPKDMLYLLSVSSADSMKFKPRAAEHYGTINKLSKLITSVLSMALAASITVDFLQGQWATALITLLLNIVILFSSLFVGSIAGMKAGKMKLATVEEACERLEEWKNVKPSEEPYMSQTIVTPLSIAGPIKVEKKEPVETNIQKNVVELI